jgi:hypothetical protein
MTTSDWSRPTACSPQMLRGRYHARARPSREAHAFWITRTSARATLEDTKGKGHEEERGKPRGSGSCRSSPGRRSDRDPRPAGCPSRAVPRMSDPRRFSRSGRAARCRARAPARSLPASACSARSAPSHSHAGCLPDCWGAVLDAGGEHEKRGWRRRVGGPYSTGMQTRGSGGWRRAEVRD